jgi:hypothetical protein
MVVILNGIPIHYKDQRVGLPFVNSEQWLKGLVARVACGYQGGVGKQTRVLNVKATQALAIRTIRLKGQGQVIHEPPS